MSHPLVAHLGWLGRLGAAVLLSGAIGLEREVHRKDAGLRTHALVGLAAALIMIVSQYGFDQVISVGRIQLDPSRVAAQVVSGVGFLGGGLIFVRRDAVRGLTTAASVWLTAAVGLACGAGLELLAAATVLLGVLVVSLFEWVERRLIRSKTVYTEVRLTCRDEPGVLAAVTAALAALRCDIYDVSFDRDPHRAGVVGNTFRLRGPSTPAALLPGLRGVPGVLEVQAHREERMPG